MATEAQIAANQANAQHSTGPRTDEGKKKASYNARRHGITGQMFAMSPGDDLAFHEFELGLIKSLQPAGHMEKTLVSIMARDYWRLTLGSAIEQNILAWGHDKFADQTNAANWQMHAAATQVHSWTMDDRAFTNISIYQARLRSVITKNEKRLDQLQAERLQQEATALSDAALLLKLAQMKQQVVDTKELTQEIGFVFSNPAMRKKLNQNLILEEANYYAKHGWSAAKPWPGSGIVIPNLPEAA